MTQIIHESLPVIAVNKFRQCQLFICIRLEHAPPGIIVLPEITAKRHDCHQVQRWLEKTVPLGDGLLQVQGQQCLRGERPKTLGLLDLGWSELSGLRMCNHEYGSLVASVQADVQRRLMLPGCSTHSGTCPTSKTAIGHPVRTRLKTDCGCQEVPFCFPDDEASGTGLPFPSPR